MLEIKNAVVVIFLIFLNHNGLRSRVKSSSQLRQADSTSGQLTAFTIYGPHRKYYMIKSFKHRAKKKRRTNWQIQIILTQRNQYRAQVFVYAYGRLRTRYAHGWNRACNL